MVAHLDAILPVHKCNDSVPHFARLAWRPKVLKDLNHTFSEFRFESLKDQVWVALRHGSAHSIGDIRAQDDIM